MLPRLYPILDLSTFSRLGISDEKLARAARTFLASGISILQLRAKDSPPQQILTFAAAVRGEADSSSRQAGTQNDNVAESSAVDDEEPAVPILILNDRPDLALLAGFDGCHLGQDDLSIAGARKILPRPKILGLSTHNEAQVRAGDDTDPDYLAIGPVYATASKQNPDPVLGLDEFSRLRRLTTKPVVAIGGITRHNARSVLDAGADSVAIIGDLYRGCTPENFATQLQQNIRDILAKIL